MRIQMIEGPACPTVELAAVGSAPGGDWLESLVELDEPGEEDVEPS